MAEASTFFNEENMKVIRNIFKEELEKQEKNIGNLIRANFKTIMEEIKKSKNEIKILGKEICDLKSSLEFTENVSSIDKWGDQLKTTKRENRNFII